jgi:hypothetical protein
MKKIKEIVNKHWDLILVIGWFILVGIAAFILS